MIIWTEKAKNDIQEIYDFIYLKSPQNAEMVVVAFINFAETLGYMPYKFPKEEFSDNIQIRMAIKWSYKIIYLINGEDIIILDIFSCKQDSNQENF